MYKPQIVLDLEEFYGDILNDPEHYGSIYEHLEAIAQRMWEGLQHGNNAVCTEINNYHPSYLGMEVENVLTAGLTQADCQHTTANQYGYSNWETVKEQTKPYDLAFEKAVDMLLEGAVKDLENQLKMRPNLVHQCSQYGHSATLLHYAGNNGVELWRQKIPYNLADGIGLLLASGADKNAKMKVYGGAFTTWELLKTSAHPYDSGLMDVLALPFQE